MWGNDYERYHQALVATTPILSEDRDEMKAKWGELKGTGEYEAWAKQFLADKGYTLKDSYSLVYTADPSTWDVLATSKAVDSEAIINTYDGLAEYDVEGVLQPALAESWEVSDDGLTWTFHLRQGVSWVDSQGSKVADVKADDFVAGMQHMMDAKGGLEYLVQGVIVNADEYINGVVTDFAEVGVKATDDYTLEYSLVEPCTYFDTMLGYGVFAPMSRSYYESKGGKFGAEYDNSAADYTYGTSKDNIAYCGPYVVSNATEKATIVFEANPSYWNAANINVHTITWVYNDGTDPTKNYSDFKAGVQDGVTLTDSVLKQAQEDKLDGDDETIFDKYHYISDTNATTYNGFYNVNRYAFAVAADDTKVISPQTAADAARTRSALQNQNFRLALNMALDRGTYNAQLSGEDLKFNNLRNMYTPGTFISLSEDVTVDINGSATTFKAGTFYGEIVQAQIDADGIALTVWDPKADGGVGSSDGFDGWYNPEQAVKYLDAAIEELGIEISEENPIYIDYPWPSFREEYSNQANAYKQSIEASLGGKVIINLVECTDADQWYGVGYDTTYGYEADYDIYDLSGWGPDYGDPSTYLGTMLPDFAGYMTKCIGLF